MHKKFWVAAAVLAALLALSTYGVVAYFKRVVPQDLARPPIITGKILTHVSEASKKQLMDLLTRESIVVGISAVQADLIKNQRQNVFFQADDPDLQAAWEEYLARRPADEQLPKLFSSERPELNNRVANIFNGSFFCTRFENTIIYHYWPAGAQFAPWTCAVPLPPGVDDSGDFVGYINLYLASDPTDAERKRLALHVTQISKDIYKRDVENMSVE